MRKLRCVYSVLKMAEDLRDQDDESTVIIVKKPNATSIVWNYFGLEANEGGTPKGDKDQKPIC